MNKGNDMSAVQPPEDPFWLFKIVDDILFWCWLMFISGLAALLSTLTWVNQPMPSRTWKQWIVTCLNGISLAILAALYFGDDVVSGHITPLRFMFYILLASMGGGPLLQRLGAFTVNTVQRLFDNESK